MTSTPQGSSRLCQRCSCHLARDNAEHLCSPCTRRVSRQRWASASTQVVDNVHPGELEEYGIAALIDRHHSNPASMVASLLASGILPRHLRRYESLLVRLCDLGHLSHSAAARELRLTRWTVAAWRQRLGLTVTARTTPSSRYRLDSAGEQPDRAAGQSIPEEVIQR
jgi:hypothetical protein